MAELKNEDSLAIVDELPLDMHTKEIADSIIKEDDVEKVKDLTALFNLNQRKKNVVRLMRLNGLLDTISDQMINRFEHKADEFSNHDLLDYMQVVQSTIDRTQKSLDLIAETPAIQVNTQNNVNINVDSGLDRDARERVANAIKAILGKVDELEREEHSIEVTDITDSEDGN